MCDIICYVNFVFEVNKGIAAIKIRSAHTGICYNLGSSVGTNFLFFLHLHCHFNMPVGAYQLRYHLAVTAASGIAAIVNFPLVSLNRKYYLSSEIIIILR